jgi:hypothetical protein
VEKGVNKFGLIDANAYREARDRHTADELRPYAGQWVAWNFEGTKIVAHHEDAQEVVRQVRAIGLNTDRVVMEHLPPAEHFDELL